MKTCCVVVIGHVDHGKTALVHALTGTQTDRLPEEKARGLSITPGFAHRTYPSGIIDFVDAPGHADFISAMVSGASGAQAALLVVSINEGICAQTLEHLRIAGLLGIRQAVIAVTKADLLTPSEQADRLHAIEGALSQTALASAPLVACSVVSGDGLDHLNVALENLMEGASSSPSALHSFLPIDRVFSLQGRGTIVTGTLLGAALSVEDTLTLHPMDRVVTLRGLQSRGTDRSNIQPNERMSANLRGIAQDDIPRGAVLCAAGAAESSLCIDVHCDTQGGTSKKLKHMQELRVLFGTTSEVAQVRLFKVPDPNRGFAQLRFRKPVVCFAGQKAILRSLSPVETIGGALILDPQAKPTRPNDGERIEVLKAANEGDLKDLADTLVKAGGGVADLSTIARLARLHTADARKALEHDFLTLQDGVVSSAEAIKTAKSAMLELLSAYHSKYPLRKAAPRASTHAPASSPLLLQYVEDALLADNRIHRHDTMLARYDHDPMVVMTQTHRNIISEIEDQFRQAGLSPPTPEYLSTKGDAADLLQLLLDNGTLIALRNVALNQTLVFHKDTVAAAMQALATAFPAAAPFTTSQARSALGTSRRVVVPLLEYFDSTGMTLRQEDTRQLVAANLVPQANSQG